MRSQGGRRCERDEGLRPRRRPGDGDSPLLAAAACAAWGLEQVVPEKAPGGKTRSDFLDLGRVVELVCWFWGLSGWFLLQLVLQTVISIINWYHVSEIVPREEFIIHHLAHIDIFIDFKVGGCLRHSIQSGKLVSLTWIPQTFYSKLYAVAGPPRPMPGSCS